MKRTTIKIACDNLDCAALSDVMMNLSRRELMELAGRAGSPKKALKDDTANALGERLMEKNPAVVVTLTFDL
jgi:hypothetical protein